MEAIDNKIANSGLVNLDLEDFLDTTSVHTLDIKNWLFQEMIIKEKEFKAHLEEHNWDQYDGHYVCFFSSVDAIIPNWAWLMIANKLQGKCTRYFNGTPNTFKELLINETINRLDTTPFIDKRVLIKGCSDKSIPSSAFTTMASKLLPIVKSLMFGEACSNVPIYKQKKK